MANSRVKVKGSQIDTKAKYKKFIISMIPGVTYDMPKNFPYSTLEIDFDLLDINDNDRECPYSWTAGPNFSVTRSVSPRFPTKGNYVIRWSTEGTAKLNLFNNVSWMYNVSGTIKAEYNTK